MVCNRLPRRSLLLALTAFNLVLFGDVFAAAPSAPARGGATFEVDPKEFVKFLSSDDLEGRGVGTEGLNKAADFIAGAYKKLGLKPPPGQENYFQTFKATTVVRPAEETSLTFGPTPARKYILGEDYIPLSFSAEAKFDGPLVFVGYGIMNGERGYDDYAGVDVKGKVALALRYEPHDADGFSRFAGRDDWSRHATLTRKAEAAAAAGASGLVLVNPPTFHEEEDPLVPFSRSFPGDQSKIPVIQVRRRVVDEWLKKAGHAEDLKALQEKIDDVGEPHSAAIDPKATVSADVSIDRVQSEVKNVVAVLPGKGTLADEYVVVGAHYDHLGRGGLSSLKPLSGAIHNGADDNASGTAAMLELAERFTRTSFAGRSIIFAAFTAEEMGLLGSKHFVDKPPVPLDKIAYMINLDMVGRLEGNALLVAGAGTAPGFDAILAEVDEASELRVQGFGRGGFGPSDHMSFALKKIPVLFLHTGQHADYHRPTDDANKINYKGIDLVVDFTHRVVEKLLTQPREQYVAADDAHSVFGGGPGTGGGGFRASLGVVPDYGAEGVKGVKISGTSPGSPAEKAGLKEGDVLVQFGEKKLDNVYDLTEQLTKAKPGTAVKLGVERGGERIELEATLAAPRR